MAKNTPPATAGDPAPDPSSSEVAATPAAGFWRYVGHLIRVYAHIPVTVEHGDVIAHPGPPADDGHWEQHDGPATREPDNVPQPAPAAPAEHPTVEE